MVLDLGHNHKVGKRKREYGGQVRFAKDGRMEREWMAEGQMKHILASKKLKKILNILLNHGHQEVSVQMKGDPDLRFMNKGILYYIPQSSFMIHFFADNTIQISIRCTPASKPASFCMPLECFATLVENREKFF